ncbi:SH3 domain-containing protein [Azospirillum agricola]|uniref:SH3 domain-containing protein n=1 Tax=Azospirillum agricola TaxID=1720247 RepID=UPI000A0F31BC|nr:SH3 domain-containing protein [Azospirillum agricola]SMH57361.1 SH3 domain-containing protein [Azospirillum lipoferum]
MAGRRDSGVPSGAAGTGSAAGTAGARARLARVALLALLALPATGAGAGAAARPPEERFTPAAPAPTVAMPRLTPSGSAQATGLTPGTVLQPAPVPAPPLSPIQVPGPPPVTPRPSASPAAPGPAKPPHPTQPPALPPKVAAAPAGPPAPPVPDKPPAAVSAARRAVVATAAVKLRAAPRPDARALDQFERGDRLEALGPAVNGWVPVGRNGRSLGYVAADYLADAAKPTEAKPALGRYAKASREDKGCALPDDIPTARRRAPLPAGSVARVLADANLRVAPACDARVEDVLESGERVTVLEVTGSWYRVGRKGRTLGYVGAALLGAAKSR